MAGKRVAVVVSGGGGAAVAVIGAARAFEEAGLEPELICGCSGGGLFSSLWAAGLSAQEMADFALSWEPERYLDPQWLRLPRFVLTALRGFSGVMKGEAVERLFNGRFGGLTVGELPIALETIVYNTDLGLIEYLGTHTTPDVPLGRVVRITIALPPFIEAVEVGGHLYVDGGVVELLPIQPVLDRGPFDHVFGLNFMLPERLTPDDITGWHRKPMGIVLASRELQQAYHVEFARRAQRELGDALTIIDAADPRLCRGGWLMDLFIDRSRWPELIRRGYERTSAALERLRRPPSRSITVGSPARPAPSGRSSSVVNAQRTTAARQSVPGKGHRLSGLQYPAATAATPWTTSRTRRRHPGLAPRQPRGAAETPPVRVRVSTPA